MFLKNEKSNSKYLVVDFAEYKICEVATLYHIKSKGLSSRQAFFFNHFKQVFEKKENGQELIC